MKNLFDSWKYIVKNIWFVLPFAVVPAVFLALSLDYSAILSLLQGFFTGSPRLSFWEFFRAWSILGVGSWLGGVYSVLAFVCVVVFSALMLAFAEKHMRIGKRTLSGIVGGFFGNLLSATVITLVYTLFYELWALVFSAVLFLISNISSLVLVYILGIAAFLLFTYVLIYVATVFYLWMPCRQMTGFGFYDSFLYSYRLMLGIRWELVLSFLISLAGAFVVLGGTVFLTEIVFRIAGVVVFAFLFLSFCLRMETAYFRTDKLDREDILKRYKEY